MQKLKAIEKKRRKLRITAVFVSWLLRQLTCRYVRSEQSGGISVDITVAGVGCVRGVGHQLLLRAAAIPGIIAA
mgnify:CR=1 FL=1